MEVPRLAVLGSDSAASLLAARQKQSEVDERVVHERCALSAVLVLIAHIAASHTILDFVPRFVAVTSRRAGVFTPS